MTKVCVSYGIPEVLPIQSSRCPVRRYHLGPLDGSFDLAAAPRIEYLPRHRPLTKAGHLFASLVDEGGRGPKLATCDMLTVRGDPSSNFEFKFRDWRDTRRCRAAKPYSPLLGLALSSPY